MKWSPGAVELELGVEDLGAVAVEFDVVLEVVLKLGVVVEPGPVQEEQLTKVLPHHDS